MVAVVGILQSLIGNRALLEFEDGEIIEAQILALDASDHLDVTFDVLHVRTSVGVEYPPSRAFIAPLARIVRASPLIE